MDKEELWEDLINAICRCKRCPLAATRINAVPGEGNKNARLMFVGEGPGRDEDLQGRPFVGKAGQLLDRMIEAIGLKREDVYIANIVKCRPPLNRVPEDEEAERCLPFLRRQVYLIRPDIIVCLGATALKHIAGKELRITPSRGMWFERKGFGIIATYHPAALLRDPDKKRQAWEDFKKIRDRLKDITV